MLVSFTPSYLEETIGIMEYLGLAGLGGLSRGGGIQTSLVPSNVKILISMCLIQA